MPPLRIAIEGPVCAGKTTLALGLRDSFGAGRTVIVPDYADFVGGGNMPPEQPTTLDDERAALSVLLEVEERRFREFPQFFSDDTRLALIDRSILTLLGHCAGLDAIIGVGSTFLELGSSVIESSQVAVRPEMLIYLDVDMETQLRRNNGKFRKGSVLLDPRLNEAFRTYFLKLASANVEASTLVDAQLSPDRVLESALSFLRNQEPQLLRDRSEIQI